MTGRSDPIDNISLIENLTQDEQVIIESRLRDLQETTDAGECKQKAIAALGQLKEIILLKQALLESLKPDIKLG